MFHRASAIARWRVGFPATSLGEQEEGVAFDVSQLACVGRRALGLHEAMAAPDLPRAPEVEVRFPAYRGKSLLRLLNWLVVERLIEPGGTASFLMDKQQGPGSCATLLTELGWQGVARQHEGKLHRVGGTPPQTAPLPQVQSFTTAIGDSELTFATDYGVFSPGHVDDGTKLLAEIAMLQRKVPAVADIGVGYGPLAVALVRNGVAERAVGTDVDCIALWLAERNAAYNSVELRTTCTAHPGDIEDTPLTVCNVPTHIDAAKTAELMRALASRADGDRTLLIVVHASLEARYQQHLTAAGVSVRRHPGPAHVVLAASG